MDLQQVLLLQQQQLEQWVRPDCPATTGNKLLIRIARRPPEGGVTPRPTPAPSFAPHAACARRPLPLLPPSLCLCSPLALLLPLLPHRLQCILT